MALKIYTRERVKDQDQSQTLKMNNKGKLGCEFESNVGLLFKKQESMISQYYISHPNLNETFIDYESCNSNKTQSENNKGMELSIQVEREEEYNETSIDMEVLDDNREILAERRFSSRYSTTLLDLGEVD